MIENEMVKRLAGVAREAAEKKMLMESVEGSKNMRRFLTEGFMDAMTSAASALREHAAYKDVEDDPVGVITRFLQPSNLSCVVRATVYMEEGTTFPVALMIERQIVRENEDLRLTVTDTYRVQYRTRYSREITPKHLQGMEGAGQFVKEREFAVPYVADEETRKVRTRVMNHNLSDQSRFVLQLMQGSHNSMVPTLVESVNDYSVMLDEILPARTREGQEFLKEHTITGPNSYAVRKLSLRLLHASADEDGTIPKVRVVYLDEVEAKDLRSELDA